MSTGILGPSRVAGAAAAQPQHLPPDPDAAGRTRRRRWIAAGVLGGVALLVLAVVFLVRVSSPGGQPGTVTLDRSVNPNGMAAVFELARTFGAEVEVAALPLDPDEVDVAVLLPGVHLDGRDRAALDRWRRQADTLTVFVGIDQLPAPASTGVAEATGPAGRADGEVRLARGPCALEGLEPVGELLVDGGDRLLAAPDADSAACFIPAGPGGAAGTASPDAGFVVARDGGSTIVLGGMSPLTNRLLAEHDNAVLAMALLAPREGTRVALVEGAGLPVIPEGADPTAPGPVDFDDGRVAEDGPVGDGRDGQGGLWELVPTGARLALLQLVVALVLFALWRAVRFGRPVPETQPVAIAGGELVVAVGELLRRTGSARRAATLLAADTRRALAERTGLPPEVTAAQLAPAVAARSDRTAEEVEALLTDPPVDDDRGLLAYARRLDALRKEVLDGIPTR